MRLLEALPRNDYCALRYVEIQRKLKVSQPHDPREQEADRIASQVMRNSGMQSHIRIPSILSVSRMEGRSKGDHCEDDELKTMQGRDVGREANASTTASTIVSQTLHSPGHPLDPATRSFMEDRFGQDFGEVRLHQDDLAANAARAISARAFTVSHDIIIGAGEYEPGTESGLRLISHELTHVLQQRKGLNSEQTHRPPADSGRSVSPIRAELLLQRKSAEELGSPAPEYSGAASFFDDGNTLAIRDKLKKKKYPPEVLEEMMDIERQMRLTSVPNTTEKVDQIVLQIELRWMSVETMRLVDKYSKKGLFQFPNQDMGYMLNGGYWTNTSDPFAAPGDALKGQKGYERNIFRPNYDFLAVPPTAAQAIDAIFAANPRNPIVLDCNAMMVAIQYRAMKLAFGDEKFNKMFPKQRQGLYIGPVGDPQQELYPEYGASKSEGSQKHPFLQLGLYVETDYTSGSFTDEKIKKELVKGDWVYFANHKEYADYKPDGMWRGEHAMYVGDGKFMGAGLVKQGGSESTFTYDEVLSELQKQYEDAYQKEKDKKITKAKLTKGDLPGIVARLTPNVSAIEGLPKVKK